MTETIHDLLLDRMPAVARGTDRWTAEDRAHLAGCAECGGTWRLITGAGGLGAEVERSFDAVAAGRAISARLRAARARGRAWRWTGLGLAAAAAVALYVAGPPTAPSVPSGPMSAAVPRFLPELDSLSTDELTAVAEGLDLPASQLELIEGQPLFDLDTTQLERVLRSLEG